MSNSVGSTLGAEYSGIYPYNGLNISDCQDSCREEEGSGSPYPRNACECSNNVFYAEQELGIDCNLSRILYYYHPDYLGHNEYITDITGRPYRYFHFSAFGESLIEKNTNYGQFSSPYRFNAKELDGETGNYYYGARYYNPVWGIWLGVDPLANKYPHVTPYNFVENNPIMLVDPTGLGPWQLDGNGGWIAEKGDGAETLAQDAGISRAQAYKKMEEQGYGTYVDKDGVTKSAVDPGDVVQVDPPKRSTSTASSDQKNSSNSPSGSSSSNDTRTESASIFDLRSGLNPISNALERADRVADDIAQAVGNLAAIWIPTLSIANGYLTIQNGEDIFGNKKEGTYDRYVRPIISIFGPLGKAGSTINKVDNRLGGLESAQAVYGPFLDEE